jgi:hypothetical protein
VSNTAIELKDIRSTLFLRLEHVTECIGGPIPKSGPSHVATIDMYIWLQVCFFLSLLPNSVVNRFQRMGRRQSLWPSASLVTSSTLKSVR